MFTRDAWSSLLTACVAAAVLAVACPAAAADLPLCKGDLPNTKAYGGIVNVTTKKSWQPRGGDITFVIETPTSIPNDALITVCFGWKHAGRQTDPKEFVESHPTRVVKLEPDSKTVTIAATVPELTPAPPLFPRRAGTAATGRTGAQGVYQGFWTVPVADVRILIYRPSGESVVDVLTTVGITRVAWAVFAAFAAVAIALTLLYHVSRIRQPQLKGVHPVLRIIASERNYASLSQLQIVLWTLVVGASAVYVIALSGDLIEISGGTLVLLGISGATSIATRWKGALAEQRSASRPSGPGPAEPAPSTSPAPASAAPAAPAPLAPSNAPPATVAPAPPVPPKVLPEWSDLVIGVEMVDGRFVQTIDVTRVQMLFFTLIIAAFVVLKVVTSYEIPPIPDGFMTLMGISNGVYLGSKFAK